MTRWVCPSCGHVEHQPPSATEVLHFCKAKREYRKLREAQ